MSAKCSDTCQKIDYKQTLDFNPSLLCKDKRKQIADSVGFGDNSEPQIWKRILFLTQEKENEVSLKPHLSL